MDAIQGRGVSTHSTLRGRAILKRTDERHEDRGLHWTCEALALCMSSECVPLHANVHSRLQRSVDVLVDISYGYDDLQTDQPNNFKTERQREKKAP